MIDYRRFGLLQNAGVVEPVGPLLAKSTVIKPEFQRGDFDRGINSGVDAMLATIRGEAYRGSGRTAAQSTQPQAGGPLSCLPWTDRQTEKASCVSTSRLVAHSSKEARSSAG